MSPYDDIPSTRRARTSHSWDDLYPGGHDYPPEDAYPAPAARASVGRASVGRASVPDQGYGGARYDVDPYGPTYEPHAQGRDPYGSGPLGSGPYGSGPYGDPPPVSPPVFPVGPGLPGPMGQPGPGQEMPGRGVVGRASVRPISPSGPPPGVGPGGGDGPGGRGPGGPGGRGPRNPFGRGGRGAGPDGPDGDGRRRRPGASDPKRAKKARRRNLIIAAFAVFIMLTGVGVVGATYYVDGVKTSDQLKFPETTTVYYSNGKELAKLGEVTRYPLKFAEMNDAVVESIVASEDKTFWTNEGVDFTGVMRAAWNNFTGGSTQGASTITQQYARVAFDLEGATYSRKLREAVMAWKIDDQLSKKEILEYYLNSVPFGRQTYGIEAAAQAFFGKTANRNAKLPQITDAEAMVLVSMVKQPNPDPDDPDGSPGYDPTFSPKAEEQARARWDYVRGQMVELGYLSPEENAAIAFPKPESFRKYDPKVGNGMDKPDGLVVNHVLSELTQSPTSVFKGKSWKSIREGGYKIYTTIHQGAQKAAEAAADEHVKGSYMSGQPASLQAALVAVEPGTGRVLAYFGGHDGKGADYGGFYYDEAGVATGVGRFPSGSSFKVYTLAAALREGYSLNSYWQWTPHDMPGGRTGTNKIRNASSCPTDMNKKTGACSLLNSTIASLNVPFYELTVSVTPAKVLAMARDAGIDYMWTDQRVRQELYKTKDTATLTPSKFDIILGIGQYPITVMDHANGLATFAAGGLRAQAHFVTKVTDGDRIVYGETLPKPNQQRILIPQASDNLTYALSQVPSAKSLNIGWDAAGKTGTWEYNKRTDQNAHAWMVGYTKKIAAAVWVGNEKDEKAIVDKNKSTIWGSGIPASIWRKFMTDANAAMKPKKENTQFNGPVEVGNTDPDRSVPSPTPPPQPTFDPGCFPPGMCPSPNPSGPAPVGNGGARPPSTLPPPRQTGALVAEP